MPSQSLASLLPVPIKPDPADIIHTQSCRKAQLESRPLKGMGGDSPIQMKNSRCLPVTNFNSVMKLLLKIT